MDGRVHPNMHSERQVDTGSRTVQLVKGVHCPIAQWTGTDADVERGEETLMSVVARIPTFSRSGFTADSTISDSKGSSNSIN